MFTNREGTPTLLGVQCKKQRENSPISRALYTDFQRKTYDANDLDW